MNEVKKSVVKERIERQREKLINRRASRLEGGIEDFKKAFAELQALRPDIQVMHVRVGKGAGSKVIEVSARNAEEVFVKYPGELAYGINYVREITRRAKLQAEAAK